MSKPADGPMPLKLLAQCVCDDGADFDDSFMGYFVGEFDEKTGILELSFGRCVEFEATSGDDYDSASYRFQFINEPPF